MSIARCEQEKPRKRFDNFKNTLTSYTCVRIRSQPLVKDPNLTLKCLITEIQDVLLTLAKLSLSKFGLET